MTHPKRNQETALGDLIADILRDSFGIDLKWGTDGKLPEYLTLVCGFFHNAGHVTWNG